MMPSDCSIVRKRVCECGLMREPSSHCMTPEMCQRRAFKRRSPFLHLPLVFVSFWLKYTVFCQESCWVMQKVGWTLLPFANTHWVPLGSEDNGNPMQFEGVMQFRRVLQFYAFRPVAWIRVSVVYTPPPSQTAQPATVCSHVSTNVLNCQQEDLFFLFQSLTLVQRFPQTCFMT